VSELQGVTPHGGAQELQKFFALNFAYDAEGRAELQLGDFAAAERSEAKALEARKSAGAEATDDQRRLGELSTWLALAEARQGRMSDAAKTIAPVVKFQRELALKNRGDKWLPLELASALYVEALTDPKTSAALLLEAARLVEALPAELRSTHDVRQWREPIRQAQQSPTT